MLRLSNSAKIILLLLLATQKIKVREHTAAGKAQTVKNHKETRKMQKSVYIPASVEVIMFSKDVVTTEKSTNNSLGSPLGSTW